MFKLSSLNIICIMFLVGIFLCFVVIGCGDVGGTNNLTGYITTPTVLQTATPIQNPGQYIINGDYQYLHSGVSTSSIKMILKSGYLAPGQDAPILDTKTLDTNSKFSFLLVGPGEYTVDAYYYNYISDFLLDYDPNRPVTDYPSLLKTRKWIKVDESPDGSGVTLKVPIIDQEKVLQPPTTIKGQYTDGNTPQADKNYIVNINIYYTDPNISYPLTSTTTVEPNATYSVTNITPGNYLIEIVDPDNHAILCQSKQPIGGSYGTTANINLKKGEFITITPTPASTGTSGPTSTPGGPTSTPGGPTSTPTTSSGTPTATATPAKSGEWWYWPAGDSYNDSVFFTSSTNGWLGAQRLYKTTDGGKTWTKKEKGMENVSLFTNIYFYDSSNGWVGAAGPSMYKTVDGGENWTKLEPPFNPYTTGGLCFTSTLKGWAADGTYGYVYNTIDGGTNWTKVTVNNSYYFNSIYFINSSTGWAVGNTSSSGTGVVYTTADGGSTWTKLTSEVPARLSRAKFFSVTNGCALGYDTEQKVYRTTDGGKTWTAGSTKLPISPFGLSFGDFDNCWIVAWYDPIYHSNNGGNSWTEETVVKPAYDDVFFLNSSTGWAVAPNQIFKYKTLP